MDVLNGQTLSHMSCNCTHYPKRKLNAARLSVIRLHAFPTCLCVYASYYGPFVPYTTSGTRGTEAQHFHPQIPRDPTPSTQPDPYGVDPGYHFQPGPPYARASPLGSANQDPFSNSHDPYEYATGRRTRMLVLIVHN